MVGDVSRHIAESTALRDFVHEISNGGHIWFLPTYDAFDTRPRPAG